MRRAVPIQNPLLSSPLTLSPFNLTSPPLLDPTTPSGSPNHHQHHNNESLFVSVFLALFLPCVGILIVFLVYICLLWFATRNNQTTLDNYLPRSPVKQVDQKGLSQSELEKLPRVTGEDMMGDDDGKGRECMVCLEEMKGKQPVRLVPGCNHGFHLECADTWLSHHPACPVCRANVHACTSSNANQ